MYAINFNGILLVARESFCLKDPEAAFLGFANLSLILLKSLFSIKTSPRISISVGRLLNLISAGISFIVLKFSVISSPSLPSPRESPFSNFPLT